MIQAWFNERGFYIRSKDGCSKYIYDVPRRVMDNAALLYEFRWSVFGDMLEVITTTWDNAPEQDLVLLTDSRLVEELEGEIEPDSYFSKELRRYFNIYDKPRFSRVCIEKCAKNVIEAKLNEQAILESGPESIAKDVR